MPYILVFALNFAASGGGADESFVVVRNFERKVAPTNVPIVVTALFTNRGSNQVRGFCYTDHVPAGIAVSTCEILLDGQAVTNYSFEFGWVGDVYSGMIPYRWILERPGGVLENNLVAPEAIVQISYSLLASNSGVFSLEHFDWIGGESIGVVDSDPLRGPVTLVGVVFGHSRDSDHTTVSFVSVTNTAVISVMQSSNGFQLEVSGGIADRQVVDVSTNLISWAPLITNTAPFQFSDTEPWARQRFYRTRLLP